MRTPTLLAVLTTLVCAFLLAPVVIVVVASVSPATFVGFPPTGISLRWYLEIARRSDFVDALALSLRIALLASAGSLVVGVPTAIAIARYRVRGEAVLSALILSPLVLPAIVLGLAILEFYSELHLASGTWTIVAGHMLLTAPLTVRLVTAALAGIDPALERAARSLGADPGRAFRLVTLPLIAPTVAAAALLAFVVSFDDVSMALFLAGPRTTTLPVLLFAFASQETSPILTAASSLLILVVAAAALILDRAIGIRGALGRAA